MQIYDIKQLVRDNVIIDVTVIDNEVVETIDQYFFKFPLQRQLVYAYLKTSSNKISTLHKIFSKFSDIKWFDSKEHQELLKNDDAYAKVVNRYVRNPHTWVNATMQIQPYFFDSKYLLIGEYQSLAKQCVHNFLTSQFNHYTIPYSTTKFVDAIQHHDKWFINKKSIENTFYESILSDVSIPQHLLYKWYNNYIEFYDTKSDLTLQFELQQYKVQMRLIWWQGSKKCSRATSQYDLFHFLQRNQSMFKLHQKLSKSLDKIQEFRTKLEQNIVNNQQSYDILLGTVKYFLDDLHHRNDGSYIKSSQVFGYVVHTNSVERMIIRSTKSNKIRVYRRVKYLNDKLNRTNEIRYASYLLKGNDTESQAKELLHNDLLSISPSGVFYNLYDFELLATSAHSDFALQWFKVPPIDTVSIFDDYVAQQNLLEASIQYHLQNNVQIEDTRVKGSDEKTFISTNFERYQLDNNTVDFDVERKENLSLKRRRIRQYSTEYKKQIQYYEQIKEHNRH